jgi:hypothetical protein
MWFKLTYLEGLLCPSFFMQINKHKTHG